MLSALSLYQIISHRVHGVHGEPRSKKYFSLFLPCWLLVLSGVEVLDIKVWKKLYPDSPYALCAMPLAFALDFKFCLYRLCEIVAILSE